MPGQEHDLAFAPVRAVLYGFGKVNQAVLRLALLRPWLKVCGIIVRSPAHDRVPASRLVPGAPPDLALTTAASSALETAAPDVVLIATRSRLAEVRPQLALAASVRADIIATAEELAYIEPADGPDALAIHQLARKHGVAILPAGVNPGFLFDVWPLAITGLAWDVRRLVARRVVDVSVFGPLVRASLGIGYRPDDFRAGVEEGRISGHLGFRESLRLLSARMGRSLSEIAITTEPIVADRRIELVDGVVEAGDTAGAEQRAVGVVDGEAWIEVALTLHVAPASASLEPIDEVRVEGTNNLSVRISPGASAISSTAAQVINNIPRALAAPAGFHAPGSLPLAAAWLSQQAPTTRRRRS